MTVLEKLNSAKLKLNALEFSSLNNEDYLGEYLDVRNIINDFRLFLSGKTVVVSNSEMHPSIEIDGNLYTPTSCSQDLISVILPVNSKSTILNLRAFTLNENGRLPKKANTKRLNNWGGDGEKGFITENNF